MDAQKCKLGSLANYFGDIFIAAEYYPLKTGKEKAFNEVFLRAVVVLSKSCTSTKTGCWE